jgi:CMP-2-keto-3-deoxyoctulosonic acid synthetase
MALRFADRALSYEHGTADDQVEACCCANTTARLMNAFQGAMLTLQKLRSGGNQTVTVQHVNVQPGGQAVVVNVQGAVPMTEGTMAINGNALHCHLSPRCGARSETTRPEPLPSS